MEPEIVNGGQEQKSDNGHSNDQIGDAHYHIWTLCKFARSYTIVPLYNVDLIQGGPAKVKPLTFLLVTFECIAKIQ